VPKLPVNAQTYDGRIKVEDAVTGRKKYIDGKKGLVYNEEGNLTHKRR
jgi:hypothetical protein